MSDENILKNDLQPEGSILEKRNVTADHDPLLEKLFSDSNFPIAILNTDLVYLRVNHAFAEICGCQPGELIGKYHFDIFPYENSVELITRLFNQDEPVVLHSLPYNDPNRPEQELHYRDWRFEVLRENLIPVQVVLFTEDVTRHVMTEDAFRRAEIRFDHIFEAQPDACILVDRLGRIESVNQKTEELFGYSRQELFKQRIDMLMPERFRRVHGIHMSAFAEEPRTRPLGSGVDLVGIRKSGEEFPIDITLNPRVTDEGLITLAVIRDISQRRRAEIALKEQTEFVKLLSDVAIASNEAETIEGALIYALDRICSFTKWPIGHALLRNPNGDLISTGLWHLEDTAADDDFVTLSESMIWKQGEGLPGLVMEQGKAAWITDISKLPSFKRISQASLKGIQSGFAFPIWSGKEVVGALEFFSIERIEPQSSLMDVMPSIGTQLGRVIERKRIEDERRTQGTRLLAVLNTLPVGVFVADETGLLIMNNKAGEKIWGKFLSVGIDQYNQYKAWWADSGKRIESDEWAMARALKHGEVSLDELITIESFDGERKTLLNSAFPLHDADGNISGAIVVNQDVTERLRMEAELAEVQRRLLASIESERTHLARELHDGPIQDLYSSIFFVQEASSAVESSQGIDALNSARDTIQEAISMLRVICGELRPPALTPFGLEKAIRSHIEQVLGSHPELTIHLDLEEDNQQLPEPMRLGLYRIYHQLLTNTIRHGQANEIWVIFKLNDREITLEVRDNGVGFEPPSRWINLARDGHLGLVGASERAESLGGTLSIDSAPGRGSSIRTVVPRQTNNKS